MNIHIQISEINVYDNLARYYEPAIGRANSIDPHCESYYSISPYAWCGNNFVNIVDPNGMDWYRREDGEVEWTEYKSQKELEENGIQGQYLGEAYIYFEGSEDEHVGEDGTLTGEGAKPAQVTIYGINGENDIATYRGMTTPKSEEYSTLNEDDYLASYQDMATSVYGEAGAIKAGYPPALTYRIKSSDGKTTLLKGVKKGKEVTMDGVFLHRTDWNGTARNASKGCPIIDGRQWREVEKQLGKSQNIRIKIVR